jgi:RNA polymerase-associated protein CTR9
MEEAGHLFIPVASTDEVVAVPLEDLPEDPEDLLDVLKAEEAPLSLWIDFAKAYLAQACTL